MSKVELIPNYAEMNKKPAVKNAITLERGNPEYSLYLNTKEGK